MEREDSVLLPPVEEETIGAASARRFVSSARAGDLQPGDVIERVAGDNSRASGAITNIARISSGLSAGHLMITTRWGDPAVLHPDAYVGVSSATADRIKKAGGQTRDLGLAEVDSRLLPPLKDKPGANNWWEKVGGLPSLVKRVAKHLVHERGYTESRAYATAISQIRKVCATGRTFGGKTPVKGDTKAMYCKAAAEIEAKRAAWKGRKVAEEEMSEDDAASIALAASAKLGVLAEELGPDFVWESISEGGVGAATKKKLRGKGKAAKEEAEVVSEEIVELNALIEVFQDGDLGSVEEAFVIPTLDKLRQQVKRNRRTDERRKGSSSSSGGQKRAPKGSPEGGQFISTGASGSTVTGIQKRLGIKPTGTFGGRTKRRVMQFQKRHGLQVDGVIGRQTATALLSGGKRKAAVGKLTTGIKSRLNRRFGEGGGGGRSRSSSSSSSSTAASSSRRPQPIRSPSEDSLPKAKSARLAKRGWDYHDGRWFPPGHRQNKKPNRGRS